MIKATAYYRRRASHRMVRDLPIDLAEMEADQPLIVFGKIREVVASQQAYDAGKLPSTRRAWFGVPAAPTSSRARSEAGEQSIHFAINKQLERTARSFEKYATDRVEQARLGIKDEAVNEHVEPALDSAAGSLQTARSPADFDRYALSHGAGNDTPPPLVTTLNRNPAVRCAQWDTIEGHELAKRKVKAAGSARINIRYETAPEVLLALARRNDCPAGLRDVIVGERDRVGAGAALPERLRANGVPWISDDAGAAMKVIEATPEFTAWQAKHPKGKSPPVKLSLGRAAQPTLSGEFEFPVRLDRAARQRIMEGMNAFVQRQLPGDAAPGSIVPTVFVEHQPDARNDRRNQHGHFLIGKSATVIGEDGQLAIASTTVAALTSHTIIKRLRCELAALINEELARADAEYRITGIYDRGVVDAAQGNVLGLLYPDVQAQLEARRRIQQEEELAFLLLVRAGKLKVNAKVKEDRLAGHIWSHVHQIGGADEQRRVSERLGGDPAFYHKCRMAQEAPVSMQPLRHPDAAVRALLRADDDSANTRTNADAPSIPWNMATTSSPRLILPPIYGARSALT